MYPGLAQLFFIPVIFLSLRVSVRQHWTTVRRQVCLVANQAHVNWKNKAVVEFVSQISEDFVNVRYRAGELPTAQSSLSLDGLE